MCVRGYLGPHFKFQGKNCLEIQIAWEPSAGLNLNARTTSEFSGSSGADRFFLAAFHAALSFGRPEGAPAPACEGHCLDFHSSSPLQLTLFLSMQPARVCWVAWLGALVQHFPTSTVFLSLFPSLSCVGWFHPILGFASVVIYPLTRMSHGAEFYLFQEKIAEGIYELWCWEPALGA